MWDDVVGQDRAVATLRAAAEHPSHAYLLVGGRGSGVIEAARAFAAAVIGATDERSAGLVARGTHPDVVEFEPTTATYTLPNEIRAPRSGESARRDADLPRVIPEIHKSPIEGERKVVVLRDADRMEPVVGNTLLKSIEEPPARTVILLVTDRADALLPTIRSRCQRVDFAYAPPVHSERIAAVRSAFAATVGATDGQRGHHRRARRGARDRARRRRRGAGGRGRGGGGRARRRDRAERLPAAHRDGPPPAARRTAPAGAATRQDRRPHRGHRRDGAGVPRCARGT